MLKKLLNGDNINSKPSHVLFKHIEKLMATLDKILALHIKDEYMEAVLLCWNIMSNLGETKPVLKMRVIVFEWVDFFLFQRMNTDNST